MLSNYGNGKSVITVCSVLTFVVAECESATLMVIHEAIRSPSMVTGDCLSLVAVTVSVIQD